MQLVIQKLHQRSLKFPGVGWGVGGDDPRPPSNEYFRLGSTSLLRNCKPNKLTCIPCSLIVEDNIHYFTYSTWNPTDTPARVIVLYIKMWTTLYSAQWTHYLDPILPRKSFCKTWLHKQRDCEFQWSSELQQQLL